MSPRKMVHNMALDVKAICTKLLKGSSIVFKMLCISKLAFPFNTVTHISKAHAANHQLHYGVLSYKPHADETRPYTVRNYTRMAHGPMYIMGVVGGNSSTNSAWDHFRIYGLLDRKLYRSEHLSCCLLYREKGQLITVQSNTISERRFEVPASMWSFHVGCPNDKHAQGIFLFVCLIFPHYFNMSL